METMELIIANLLLGLILLIVALLMKRFPPNSTNFYYGYRTPMSMKNSKTWEFANELAIKYLFRVALFSISVGIVAIVVGSMDLSFYISIIPSLIALFSIIAIIEFKLRQQFDKEGNPKINS